MAGKEYKSLRDLILGAFFVRVVNLFMNGLWNLTVIILDSTNMIDRHNFGHYQGRNSNANKYKKYVCDFWDLETNIRRSNKQRLVSISIKHGALSL